MVEEYDDDWVIEGKDTCVVWEADHLSFTPSENRNILGRALEWGAYLTDTQVEALAALGEDLRIEWGVFMCPARLWPREKLLVVDTSATW